MNIFSKKPPNIEKMKEQGNINGLIKTLSYTKDPQVRANAAKSLSSLEYDKKIIAALFTAMDDNDPVVRKSVLKALGKMGEKSNVKALIDQLLHAESKTHFIIFSGVIDKIYPIVVIKKLSDLLTSKNETSDVRKMAAHALEMIGIKPSEDVLSSISERMNL